MKRLLLIALAVAALASPAGATPPTSTQVTGQVVPCARIGLTFSSYRVSVHVTSDAFGRFRLTLPSGLYHLTLSTGRTGMLRISGPRLYLIVRQRV